MRARPIDDLAVRLDQRVKLTLQRPDLIRDFSLELFRLARSDPSWLQADGAQGTKAEADLKERRDEKPKTEHAERRDEQASELGEIAVDGRGVSRHGILVGRAIAAIRPNLALEDTQALMFWPIGISAPS